MSKKHSVCYNDNDWSIFIMYSQKATTMSS